MLKVVCTGVPMGALLILALIGWPVPTGGAQSGAAAAGPADLFTTSHTCMACHNGLVTPSGEDVSIGSDWRGSMMANSARDPYWHAAVRREIMDHPGSRAEIEDECSKCHMPMARYQASLSGELQGVFDHLPIGSGSQHRDLLAADGVSCALCHQITEEGLGTEASLVGGFVIDAGDGDGERPIYGPFEIDESRIRLMRSATGFTQTEAAHIQESEFCATCHTLITHALGPDGEVIGELPEQVPYQEWLHSDYVGERSCQGCHMPVVEEAMPITSVLGEPREGLSRHSFRGSNFFVLQMLQRYRAELGVEASSQELQLSVLNARQHLEDASAEIVLVAERAGGRLEAWVSIENLAGHKLPTAYPSRRVWIELTVRDRDGEAVFSSGALDPTGAIRGNDNDADPSQYELHYLEITSPDEVQIYESILVDASGGVTTGLLTGVGYIKDNRLLPAGFDKLTADADIAVHGSAQTDADFAGGSDAVGYSVDLAGAQGPFEVEAVLWYQPISYRWAENLRSYDAPEPRRFVGYYTSMAGASAVVLDRTSVTLE